MSWLLWAAEKGNLMNDLKISWSENKVSKRFRCAYCFVHQGALRHPGQKEKMTQGKANLDWLVGGKPRGLMFLPMRTPRKSALPVLVLVSGRAVDEREETGMDVVWVALGTEAGNRAEGPG